MAAKAEIELLIRSHTGLLRKDLASMRKMTNKHFQGMRKRAIRTFAGIGLFIDVRDIFRGISAVVQGFAAYEKALSNVQAKTGAARVEMGQLRLEIERVAITTVYNLRETAESAGYLAQAGLDLRQITNAIKPVLDLAAATGFSAQRAGDIVTNIATPLGLLDRAEDLERVGDVVARVTAKTNVNLGEVGESFSYAASTVEPLNSTLEETTAVIGLLGNAGVKASRAGTFYRQSLTALARGSVAAEDALGGTARVLSKQTKTLNRLGIEIKDSDGNLRNFVDVLEDMKESGATAGDIISILGSRAGTTAVALLNQGIPALRKMTKMLEGAGGAAEEMANIQKDNLWGDFKILASGVINAANEVSQSGFGDAIRGVVQWLTRVSHIIVPAARALGFVLTGAIIAVSKVLSTLYDLITGPLLPAMLYFLGTVLVIKVKAAKASLLLFGGAIKKVSLALWALAVANPIVAIIGGAVAAIGFIGYFVLKYSNQIIAIGKTIGTWVQGVIGGIRDLFVKFLNWIIEKYNNIKGMLGFEVTTEFIPPTDVDFGADFSDILAKNLAGIEGAKSGLDELKEYAGKTIREIGAMLGLTGPRETGGPADEEDDVEEIEDDTQPESTLMAIFGSMKDAAKEAGIYVSGTFKNAMVETVNAFKAGGEESKQALKDIAKFAVTSSKRLQKFMKKVAIAQVIWDTGAAIMRAFREVSFPKSLGVAALLAYRGLVELKRIKSTPVAQAHDGLTNVPSTGTYFLETGERVLSRSLNMDLKDYLTKERRAGTRNVYLKGSDIFKGEDIHRAFGGDMGTVILQADVR